MHAKKKDRDVNLTAAGVGRETEAEQEEDGQKYSYDVCDCQFNVDYSLNEKHILCDFETLFQKLTASNVHELYVQEHSYITISVKSSMPGFGLGCMAASNICSNFAGSYGTSSHVCKSFDYQDNDYVSQMAGLSRLSLYFLFYVNQFCLVNRMCGATINGWQPDAPSSALDTFFY